MTTIFSLEKNKKKIFRIFKKLKSLCQETKWRHGKVLRSHQNREYNSRNFDKFCKDKGIERRQNGVATLTSWR